MLEECRGAECPITLQREKTGREKRQEYLESTRTRKKKWRSLGVYSLGKDKSTYTTGDSCRDGESVEMRRDFPVLAGDARRCNCGTIWHDL